MKSEISSFHRPFDHLFRYLIRLREDPLLVTRLHQTVSPLPGSLLKGIVLPSVRIDFWTVFVIHRLDWVGSSEPVVPVRNHVTDHPPYVIVWLSRHTGLPDIPVPPWDDSWRVWTSVMTSWSLPVWTGRVVSWKKSPILGGPKPPSGQWTWSTDTTPTSEVWYHCCRPSLGVSSGVLVLPNHKDQNFTIISLVYGSFVKTFF